MILKNPKEERKYREAAEISMQILQELGNSIKEGVTSLDIDNLALELCKQYHVKPSFKGVGGYKYNSCISVNDIAVHGVPNSTPFKNGDLVSIDFGVIYKGFHTDHCWTWSVGKPSSENLKLMNTAREAVENAANLAISGTYTGDLGNMMETTALKNGYRTVKMFVGHGIGKSLHEFPEIPAFGEPGTGDLLREGMVVCVECQVVDDTGEVYISKEDGWSVHTELGGNSAMYEFMIIVGKRTPEFLTDTRDWPVVA
jgi:methionyl aminopeptidase